MSAPVWFDAKNYLSYKLEQLESVGNDRYDSLSLAKAFRDAGFSTDEDGLYAHFENYGNAENVSPNKFFDADYYFQSKANAYFNVGNVSKVTSEQIQFIKDAFAKVGLSAWDHYLQYGMEEGIDPNSNFSTSKYFEAKLEKLQASDPSYTQDQMYAAFKSAGLNPVSHYYLYGADEGIEPQAGDHGRAVQELTSNADNYQGTVGDPKLTDDGNITIDKDFSDYFNAEEGTLNSEDVIDGLGGSDTLYARVNASENSSSTAAGSIEPTITNVETVLFRSQIGSGQLGHASAPVSAVIDADRITLDNETAQLTIGSDNSRANLAVEDIRHNSNVTTIRYVDADPEIGFSVYFDPQHLKANDANTSGILKVELMDVLNAAQKGQPLLTNPYNEFRFYYDDGNGKQLISLVLTEDEALITGETANYDSLVRAFNNALKAQHPELQDVLSITKGEEFHAEAYSSTALELLEATGNYVTISANSGTVSCPDEGTRGQTGWTTSWTIPPNTNYDTRVIDQSSVDCPLIMTTVEVSNVGRVQWEDASECLPDDILKGSEAGDLQIGSMSMRSGIERMDIKVDEGSWLDALYSTNNTLRMVTVEAKDINGDGLPGITTAEHLNNSSSNTDTTDGQLYIGSWEGKLDDEGYRNSNMTWTDPARLLSADSDYEGLRDVAVFDAAKEFGVYKGDINIAATITDASYDKYLKGVDTYDKDSDGNPVKNAPLSGYDDAFTYLTGEGKDVVNMTVAGDIAADVDFKLNINTNANDDLVAFRYGTFVRYDQDNYRVSDTLSPQQHNDQIDLQNVNINTENGNDTVWFYDGIVETNANEPTYLGGSLIINTGAGNDAVYANQVDLTTGGAGSGVTAGVNAYNAVWVFNSDSTEIGIDGFNGATLNNDLGTGTRTYAKDQAHDHLVAKVDFNGFTAYGTIDDLSSTSKVSAEDLNHAVMNAVNNHSVLGKLLVAKDGAGHSMLIESLVNNKFDIDDLSITFKIGAAGNYKSFTDWKDASRIDDVSKQFATHGGTEYAGFDQADNPDNLVSKAIIDAGSGNDVIALSHNGVRDIIEVNSSFGTDSILGFEYGTDMIDASGLNFSKLGFLSSENAIKNADNGNYFVKLSSHSGKIVTVEDKAVSTEYGKFNFDADVDLSDLNNDNLTTDLVSISGVNFEDPTPQEA